jgi:starch synthase
MTFILLPAPLFAQVRGNSVSVVPQISLGNAGIAPSLSAPSIDNTSLSLMPLPSPSALSALTPAPSVAPVLSAAVPLAVQAVAVQAVAVQAVPSALSVLQTAAPTTPEKPSSPVTAAAAPVRAEQQKGALDTMFDGALKIVIAGSEAVPFIKTGGLADVVDALSRGFAARGHDVTVVLPKYKSLKTAGVEFAQAGRVILPIDGRVETANILVGRREGVRVVLIEHPDFYEREGGPYAAKHAALGLSAYDAAGIDDADERFGFYARAAIEALRVLDVKPDIIQAHDWHAALIPAFLKTDAYKNDPFFSETKTALTIHNIAFQGAFALATAAKLGFDEAHIEHNGGSNYLRSGITHADAVTTVSPTYAREIVENMLFGMGLEAHLGSRDEVHGIINGIDPALYDPATDPLLARNYGVEDAAEGKAANKAVLQAKLGLDAAPDSPLFVVASRLAHQKGIDMIFDSARDIVRLGGQLAIMGTGDAETEALRAALVLAFPGKVASHPFDENAVRLLFAAADFLLMPSRFEPCGLSQLIAQRYGALPIVTITGGLADTVVDLRDDPVNGTGLIIRAIASISLSRAVADAIQGYHHPRAFPMARRAAMKKDSSWDISLDVYEALFRRLLRVERPGFR